MPDSKHINTTKILDALPLAALSTADIAGHTENLRIAGEIVAEAGILATIAALGSTSPAKALEQLLASAALHGETPPHLPALHDALTDLMGRRANDPVESVDFSAGGEVPSAARERDRCEAFRSDPGAYIKGATTSTLRRIGRHAPMDGFVEHEGTTYPWMYCATGIGNLAIADATHFIARAGGAVEAVLLVSTHVRQGVEVPGYLQFVEVR